MTECAHKLVLGYHAKLTPLHTGNFRAVTLFCSDCEAMGVLSYGEIYAHIVVPFVPRFYWVPKVEAHR